MKDYFKSLLEKSNIKLEDHTIDKLMDYLHLLAEKNKVMNLTAIREEKEIIEKHFIDSLFLKDLLYENDKEIIDVGTGAGFPGLVLAICFPEKNFLLVDSVKKKVEFLNEVIELLKRNSTHFNTAMLYVSDHGESLGENGIYLHSLPYLMAPKEQYEIPMLMWFGGDMKKETNYTTLGASLNNNYSHDNLFHTVLGMMEIESDTYNPKLDILHGVHTQPSLEALNEKAKSHELVR